MNNEIDSEDQYLSDLFSYGMVVLECLNKGPVSVYRPNYKIDKKRLGNIVNSVEDEELRDKLRKMLIGSLDDRRGLLDSYINRMKRLKLMSKNSSKSHLLQQNSTEKIQDFSTFPSRELGSNSLNRNLSNNTLLNSKKR